MLVTPARSTLLWLLATGALFLALPSASSAEVTANLSASLDYIALGGSLDLTWSSTNAESCTGDGFSTGGDLNGVETVSPTSEGRHTFSVTCILDNTSATFYHSVTVGPAVIANIDADPAFIASGETSSLNWWSENAIYCTGENFNANNSVVGVSVVGPITTTTYTVTCTGHGNAMDTASVTIVVAQTPAIDIKPGSEVNPINLKSRGKIPVAILGSDTFDVLDVDVETLAFGPPGAIGAAPKHKKGGHYRDVNDDGFTDLLSHYRTQETGIAAEDTEACVMGETFDGTALEGCDEILVLSLTCGLGFELALLVPGLMWLRQRRRSN